MRGSIEENTTWHLGPLLRVNPYNRSIRESQRFKGLRSKLILQEGSEAKPLHDGRPLPPWNSRQG